MPSFCGSAGVVELAHLIECFVILPWHNEPTKSYLTANENAIADSRTYISCDHIQSICLLALTMKEVVKQCVLCEAKSKENGLRARRYNGCRLASPASINLSISTPPWIPRSHSFHCRLIQDHQCQFHQHSSQLHAQPYHR